MKQIAIFLVRWSGNMNFYARLRVVAMVLYVAILSKKDEECPRLKLVSQI